MSDDAAPPISPYQGLEARAFWRAGVVEAGAYPPPDIYRPKFDIYKGMAVFTAGSCFAQHVGRTLSQAGYNVIDTEPLPKSVPAEIANRHGYGLYCARFGNIYTTRQFRQLLEEAFGSFVPADAVWERDGSFYDALRPNMTPGGLPSADLVREARASHLRAVQEAVAQANMVVFTLGLTEAWVHSESGTVYPTAPGTIAGRVDRQVHSFVNFRAAEIRRDFLAVRKMFQAANPDVKFLLTVSPVPLTATASGDHVLPATIYSKSVLRTVAGELSEDFDDIDYFPSFEIVSSHPSAGKFFEPNMRTVRPKAVRQVMRAFLTAHGDLPEAGKPGAEKTEKELRRERRAARRARLAERDKAQEDAVVCEEELLEAFRK
ncbi:MAG: GSCFA domain-containing protein [Pseudomonadota bacterium]